MARQKRDKILIKMRVERNGLVPVSAYDAERLASWHVGNVVEVDVTGSKTSPIVRRYWAMLNKLFKSYEPAWGNKDAAHIMLKETCSVTIDPKKTPTGEWDYNIRSLSELDDEELTEFYEHFCVALEKIGVDPRELEKHAPDTGTYEPVSVGVTPAPEASPESVTPALDQEGTAGAEDAPPSQASADSAEIDAAWLVDMARMMVAASLEGGDVDVVHNQARLIKEYHTPVEVSQGARAVGKKIYQECVAFTLKERPRDIATIAWLAGCKVKDITNREGMA